MSEQLTIKKLLLGLGIYALLSWPIIKAEDVTEKKQFNDQYFTVMLQNYCEFIMRDRFGEKHISSFDVREDKNSDMQKKDGNFRSVSVHSIIDFKGIKPQDIICNASISLEDTLAQIPPETKITIKISEPSDLSSGHPNTKSEVFTFNELNKKYPMSVGATVRLYRHRMSVIGLFFMWLDKHGWKGKHGTGLSL